MGNHLLYNVFKFSGSFHFIIIIHFFFKNRIFHDQKFFEFFSQKFFSKNFWGKVHKTLLFSGLLDYPIFQPKFFEFFLLLFGIRKTLKTDKKMFFEKTFLQQKVTKNVFMIKSLRFYKEFTIDYFQIFLVINAFQK